MRNQVFELGAVLCLFVTTACGSDSSDPAEKGPETEPNPFAMPCGNIDSGFAGDEVCIVAPEAPHEGVFMHVGPADYADQAEIDEYVLGVGDESTECYYFNAGNERTVNFFEQVYRLRPGSHHLIIHSQLLGGEPKPEGWAECSYDDGYIPIGGTQRSISEFPPSGIVAEEDAHLARPLFPDAAMKFELHFINTTDEPILREAWVNFKAKPQGEPLKILGGVFMVGGLGMSVPPRTRQQLHYECALNTEHRRVVSLFGHRHAHTDRFSVWATRGGNRELIYEDYDWNEPTELIYNSLEQNPVPDPVNGVAGGASGIIDMYQGDTIEWECDVNNTSDNTLTFANEVYTGEMCNLFGSSVTDDTSAGIASFFWRCTLR